jgi:hypothetical protein
MTLSVELVERDDEERVSVGVKLESDGERMWYDGVATVSRR